MTTTPTLAAIAWRCDECGNPATTGAIHVDLRRVNAAERARTEWEARPRAVGQAFDLSDMFAAPMMARWQVTCSGCAHNCAGCYSIDLALCRSVFALVKWTAHLYEKSWFGATNWIAFIHGVAQENGDPREAAGVW
jgi:hypothetical protein